MNPVERVLRSIDAWQQDHAGPAFVFGVIRKFGDDRSSSLAALLTYYGFLAVFPLLLVLTTVLGFVGNARLEHSVLGTTLAQFPVVGQQVGRGAAHPLHGSGLGLVVGLLGLVYGSLGVTQVAQRAMADVWNIPNVSRPGFVPRLGRSLAFLVLLAVGLAVTGLVGGVATSIGTSGAARAGSLAVATLLDIGWLFAAFRLLTPKSIPTRDLRLGAVLAGIAYSLLLVAGTSLVQRQLRHAQALYGQFAFVLGLLGWLFLVSQAVLYAAEANVVAHRRLWPRSLLQPPLTAADEDVLTAIAEQEERRPEQQVHVEFDHAVPPGASDEEPPGDRDRVPPGGQEAASGPRP